MARSIFCAEQERLSTETAQAERRLEVAEASFGDIAATLDKALCSLTASALTSPHLATCAAIRHSRRSRASEAAGW